MAESYAGKRVQKKSKGLLAALIACACVVALAAGGYVGLCAWAGGHVLPHSEAAGVDLSGLSNREAAEKLAQAAASYQGKTITLSFEQTRILCELDQAGVAFDTEEVLRQLSAGEGGFLTRGASWLGALFGGSRQEAQDPLVFENRSYFDGLLSEVDTLLTQPVRQHEAQIEDTYIYFTRGQAGMSVGSQNLEDALLKRLAENDLSDLPVEPEITEPDDPDFEELSRQVHVDPVDAFLSPDTLEVTPSVTGVALDAAAAQALFDQTAPGESCEIPLQLTEPEVTTEMLSVELFSDLLGEATSRVSGTDSRLHNVKLAASECNEVVMMPGDVFSYWDAIAPCSAAQGYQPAPSYMSGKTVDSIGGGVCQVSSSVYYAALLSNLEIVQRRNHSFLISYLPAGADATVAAGGPDFQFRNNTKYPIKIVATVSGRNLTVQIWGTKTDDTYVKMEFNTLSTTPYSTVYQIDDSVPPGATLEDVTPYTGKKVEAYRCVYSGNGTLLSRTYESTSTYRMRDQVILVNSADAYLYGLGPAPEIPPEESPVPEVPETPETPETSPSPEVPVTPPPLISPEPQPSPEPSAASEPSPEPEPSPSPEPSPEPSPSPEVDPPADTTPGTEE